MSNVASEASLATRLKVWWDAVPLVTRVVLATCTSIYAMSLLIGFDNLGSVCLSPALVLGRWQVYRLLTAAVFHAGLLHLAFNMMAFVPIGCSLERLMGSVQFAWLCALLWALGDGVYLAAAAAAGATGSGALASLARQCAVGFSGVVFGLIVVDNHTSGASARSIFGFFAVPAKLYPWALLVFWQLLLPQSSFLGHLSGVLVGQLYVWGALRRLTLSSAAVQRAERAFPFSLAYNARGFIAGSGGSPADVLPSRGGGPMPLTLSAANLCTGWLRGYWRPYPGPPPQGERSAGVRLGGLAPAAAGPAGVQQPADAKAAAAAAAEARMARMGAPSGAAAQPGSSSLPK